MLQYTNDEKCATKDSMWQQHTYKSFLEEVQDMLRQPGTIEELHQQMKIIRFEVYNKKKILKQFRGYGSWKKRRRKLNLVEVNFLNCKPR